MNRGVHPGTLQSTYRTTLDTALKATLSLAPPPNLPVIFYCFSLRWHQGGIRRHHHPTANVRRIQQHPLRAVLEPRQRVVVRVEDADYLARVAVPAGISPPMPCSLLQLAFAVV